MISIGDRKLFISISGKGSPTVILEAGLGDVSEIWKKVQPAVAEFTCVCSYDRAGQGHSDPAPTPRTCQDMVADLHALLVKAEIPSPYVLVGHSFGGMNVRLYASRYPQEIAGMVLVDAVHEDRDIGFEAVLSDELIRRNRVYLQHPDRNSECVDKLESATQLRAARRTFAFPIVVLTRGLPDEANPVWPSEALQQVETELQRDFLKLSPKSSLLIAKKSGHFIQTDEPELVVNAIRQVVSGSL
ncbi:MAG: alpha/beta fold hydrolase [Chloroflexi bacterium]|nr:alpha/beta fold hydrolase [Chloroflexota bacterium]